MAIAAELETLIARSCGDVFARLADVGRYPEWLVASGIVSAEPIDAGPVAAGSKLRIGQQIAGRASTLEGTVTVFEPGARFAFRAKDPEGISIEVDARLTPEGATCRLRWTLKLGLPLKYRFFESMVAPQVKQAAAADLERLRTGLQSVAG
ncbi:MAG: SRPBCC family protein [Chloroflexota bacterium]|nr:SRPBCC family protein [Chloroflexota bacterium]